MENFGGGIFVANDIGNDCPAATFEEAVDF